MDSPLAVLTANCVSVLRRKPVTRVLVRSSISSGSALQPSSSEPWMSARCVTAYGLPKRLREALVERDVDHLLAAHAVEHQQVLDEHRFLLHQRADAERVERVPGVGRDLDAGADLAELRRLLEHHRAEALARERQRGGEAADAAAGDDDRLLVPRRSLQHVKRCAAQRGARIGQRFDDLEMVQALADDASARRACRRTPAIGGRTRRLPARPSATVTGHRILSTWRIGRVLVLEALRRAARTRCARSGAPAAGRRRRKPASASFTKSSSRQCACGQMPAGRVAAQHDVLRQIASCTQSMPRRTCAAISGSVTAGRLREVERDVGGAGRR